MPLMREDGISDFYVISADTPEEIQAKCVFHGFLTPSPWECCHPVQKISATQSTGMLPPSKRSDAGCMISLGSLLLSRTVTPAARCVTGVATRVAKGLPTDALGSKRPGTAASRWSLRSNATLGMSTLHYGSRCRHRSRPFAHGVSLQGNLVDVVDEPVKDSIGQGGLPNRLMPVLDRQLAGDDRGPTVIAIFEQFQ